MRGNKYRVQEVKMGQEEWNEGREAIELSYDAITLTRSQ